MFIYQYPPTPRVKGQQAVGSTGHCRYPTPSTGLPQPPGKSLFAHHHHPLPLFPCSKSSPRFGLKNKFGK